jgi:hypothetical protein
MALAAGVDFAQGVDVDVDFDRQLHCEESGLRRADASEWFHRNAKMRRMLRKALRLGWEWLALRNEALPGQ